MASGRNLTFCELQREINTGRSDDFIPRCRGNGEFEPVQCHRISGVCWCVDEIGIEIPGSRTTSGLPECNGLNGKLDRAFQFYLLPCAFNSSNTNANRHTVLPKTAHQGDITEFTQLDMN